MKSYGIIEYSTITNNYIIYNDKYDIIYDSEEHEVSHPKQKIFDPTDYVNYPSYFFEGEDYNEMRLFLEKMSGQTIRITPENIAFYYVVYCKQNNILVNEERVSTYFSEESEELKKMKKEMKEMGYNTLKQYLFRKAWN